MLRVAILSFWHVHARDYAAEAERHPGAEVACVWDADAERGREEAGRRGVPFYAELDRVLPRPDVDGVVVTTPTTAHGEVIPAAARAGKHVFAEKVIAPTLREAREISAAVERSGVSFTVSLPRLYAGYTRAVKDALPEIGTVTYLRVRVSHDGALPAEGSPRGWLPERFYNEEESGGGVTVDFGAHPLYLIHHLLGLPESVNATYARFTDRAVEDGSVTTLSYANGALGVAEASFVGASEPFVIEAHGTEGSLLYTPETGLSVRRTGADSRRLDLPPDGPTPFERWVELASKGEPDRENVHAALALSALAEAANTSAREGRPVSLL
ncbi:putative dehydrogenase-related protein [Rubrobacter radiotolerans]|uniref:Gfo/Idh/MocA family oxidoreductase n=1 Tax=Rubrobacter radiotolerans TaxID=42256 RepID=A0A023X472_RUBRA|nr:Gfo/Idh/MocA family oxidoreductase [Rubrobacter radiotolerans]AHY47128.1 putative dehydrogenase-related protein [Rubrobacter radiotolerans]MDX5894533.1 Gfo/Idh/MocA family oxidoreductase [Rubrobacter radiotolerans]SMC06204.1 Predicted dehydrogenase [Rubrobacter radiotolerans DSM 5868]